MDSNASPGEGVVAHKAPKKERMTYRQEMQTIKNLPRVQRAIIAMKVGGVLLVAVGIEGLVTRTWWMALVFIPLGILVSLLPIRIRLGRCLACQSILEQDQAICPACGAPQM